MAIKAYYIENPEESVPQSRLDALGVLHWKLDADDYEKEGKLAQIRKDRNYNYVDFVESVKIPNLKEKLATFHEEHLHDDEEIRFFLNGSGYFDVRDGLDEKERWVRMECQKGDMIILPAGIYHRFIPDDKMFFHVMRLFCGEPIWTPYNRVEKPTDDRVSRKKYVDSFLNPKETSEKEQGGKRKEADELEETKQEVKKKKKSKAPPTPPQARKNPARKQKSITLQRIKESSKDE